jgi:hypothetical protein
MIRSPLLITLKEFITDHNAIKSVKCDGVANKDPAAARDVNLTSSSFDEHAATKDKNDSASFVVVANF